jgi:hypothetical protein
MELTCFSTLCLLISSDVSSCTKHSKACAGEEFSSVGSMLPFFHGFFFSFLNK